MKKLISINVLFVIAFNVWAADKPAATPDFTTMSDSEFELFAEDYRWLYEELFSNGVRQFDPDGTFKSFRVHLKDTYKYFPMPSKIVAQNLLPPGPIRGRITYVGFVPKLYAYDVTASPTGELVLNVRVHLRGATADDISSIKRRLQQAENHWNQYRVRMDFEYRFKFEIVEDETQAHFSVRLRDSTRGPYDTFWGRDWTWDTIAHELGHMLGLGDEYQTISSKIDCYEPSLMCYRDQLMYHHYYFVLRRLIKTDSP